MIETSVSIREYDGNFFLRNSFIFEPERAIDWFVKIGLERYIFIFPPEPGDSILATGDGTC